MVTPGGVIGPGEPVLDLVPSGDELVIEAYVEPTDIDAVPVGLPAQVRLTALNQRHTPTLTGKVDQVSADRLEDERSGQPYYLTRVALDDHQPELEGLALHPGMPAEVMIVTGERTTIDYLLKPISASFERALRED
jgi:membrane fusion protein, epimerase transport system